MNVIVIEEHVSKYPDPINLKKSDRVTLGEKDREFPDWIFVTDKTGKQGWAPLQYIQKSSCGSFGYSLKDYDACELNTVAGEELFVLFELNSWYRVTRSDGVDGWVPVQTVKIK